jgi:hypothetical protein
MATWWRRGQSVGGRSLVHAASTTWKTVIPARLASATVESPDIRPTNLGKRPMPLVNLTATRLDWRAGRAFFGFAQQMAFRQRGAK